MPGWSHHNAVQQQTAGNLGVKVIMPDNGQAERMNRTVKETTIKALQHPNLESLKAYVLAFVSAYNFAKHLKAIRWQTPFEAICHAWTTTPEVFKLNPRHLILGLNI